MTEDEIQGFVDDLVDTHYESALDAYGDEGAGYDYKKQAELLLKHYIIIPRDV